MSDNNLRVFKFGGTSVGSVDAIRQATAIAAAAAPNILVVVSAAAGTTDLLLGATTDALGGRLEAAFDAAATFREQHLFLVENLLEDDAARTSLRDSVEKATRELRSMCESISILSELTTRTRDAVLARGERMMAAIFSSVLASRNVEATLVDATRVIFTERRVGATWPDFAQCEKEALEILVPAARKGAVVVPGFIATGPAGEVVTLGRGGSDFSASILARSVNAESLTLYKEVSGLMTADPRSVGDARVLPQLHYREAAELAFYGAKVLHPRTMIPLIEKAIPLYLRNTFDPEASGTRIAGDVTPGSYPVKALTAIHDQSLITIEGNGMIGVPGVAARVFSALSAAGHSVSMISQASSESSICFVVPSSESEDCVRALRETFELEMARGLVDDVRSTPRVALLAIVGLGMRGTPGIAARSFSALSRETINIVAIAQGSSELNITVAIDESEVPRALVALHREFQLSKIRPLASTRAREAEVSILGFGRIGRSLVEQMIGQEKYFSEELGVKVHCRSLADRSGVLLDEQGFSAPQLRELLDRKAAGYTLFDDPTRLSTDDLKAALAKQLWILPASRPVLVDVTAEDTAPILLDALKQHSHVVLANKKPLAVPQAQYDEIFRTARENRLQFRFEATVGAGLPVLDTFAKLREAGDVVESVVGCLSGTLGYLMTQLEDGLAFSEAVRKAYALGYTEPDPRDDLSGMDVGRKALILARTLGMRLDLTDIVVEPLFTEDVGDPEPEKFLANLETLDFYFAGRTEEAKRQGRVIRYVARIDRGSVRVGLEAVSQATPMGRLRGTDNQIVIYSKRYATNPLVVIGPGAGAEVTAAGVLNDIIAIATQEHRYERAGS